MTSSAPQLALHRDDGVLSGVLPTGVVPIAEPVLLAVAVILGVGLPLTGAPGEPGIWISLATLLAVLSCSGRGGARLAWLSPALLRALEYGAVLILAGASAWTYALLGVLAFHHYDIVYRLRLQATGIPAWLGPATGGWAVRLVILLVAERVGVVGAAAVLLTVYLLVIYLSESIANWASHPHP